MKGEFGTYVLILQSSEQKTICVGALGELCLRVGFYAYVGSAFGPGGLRARVKRHLSSAKAIHWHIDHLTSILPIAAVWYTNSNERLEHTWASYLGSLEGAEVVLQRFGSSDCNCKTHLFYFQNEPDVRMLQCNFGDVEVYCCGCLAK